MLSQSNKTAIIVILIICASLLESLVFLYDRVYGSRFADFLFAVGLTRWGWLPAFIFAAAAMTATICWKPGGRVLQVLLILLAGGTFAYASYWFIGIYSIAMRSA